jgi:hypothetical protein
VSFEEGKDEIGQNDKVPSLWPIVQKAVQILKAPGF